MEIQYIYKYLLSSHFTHLNVVSKKKGKNKKEEKKRNWQVTLLIHVWVSVQRAGETVAMNKRKYCM